MAEPKLRTIKIARRHGSVSRREVTKALKYAMALHGQIPTPGTRAKKKTAASRK